MFVGRGRVGAVTLVLTGLLAVAGCSGGSDGPRTLPPLTGTPTSAPASTNPKTELAAATAVVRQYFQVINGLERAMDYRALARLMTQSCTCQRQVEAVRTAALRHHRFVGRASAIRIRPTMDNASTVDVLVTYQASAGGIIDARGRWLTTTPAEAHVGRLFHLRKVGGQWLIFAIQSVSQ